MMWRLMGLICLHDWKVVDEGELILTGHSLAAGSVVGAWSKERCRKCGASRKTRNLQPPTKNEAEPTAKSDREVELERALTNCVSALTFCISVWDESDPYIIKLRVTRDAAARLTPTNA